jgi:cobalamin-dependent methionine synthase I
VNFEVGAREEGLSRQSELDLPACPEVHFTAGLSNISFGLPARSFINRAFLSLALSAGLESAILDPLDRELRTALLAAELVQGRDDHCLNYMRAYRAGCSTDRAQRPVARKNRPTRLTRPYWL